MVFWGFGNCFCEEGEKESMIIGRATISEMPKLQRSITEQIAVVQSYPVNPTLIIMDDDSNAANDDVHLKESEGGYKPPVGAVAAGGGVVVVVGGGGGGASGHGKPPLLKSSRGRNQALPARFNDSVLHSWKKDKSEENARKKSSCFEDEDGLPKRKKTKREVVPLPQPQQPGLQLFSTVELIPESTNGNEELLVSNPRVCSATLTPPSTSSGDGGSSLPLGTKKEAPPSASKQHQEQDGRKKVSFKLQDFGVGDVVWAICGKKFPAWPGIVVDNAPERVMQAYKPATILVMFFGHNRNGQRDYGWIKGGMIFPFQEYLERFRGQTKLYGSKPADFQLAVGEALVSGPVQRGSMTGTQPGLLPTTNHCGSEEVTGSNVRELTLSDEIALLKRKESQPCDSCGVTFPSRTLRKIKDTASESQSWCEQCLKQKKSKQYCGICKIVWHQSEGGHWVCCDGCDVWVHAECANISCKLLKDLKKASYSCPDCRVTSSHKFSLLSKGQAEIRVEPNRESEIPENIIVVCNGVEGLYFRSLHLVQCMCQLCGTNKITLPDWERHVGCRAKKWKSSVKLQGSRVTLETWLTGNNVDYNGPKLMDKERLLGFLQEPYVPVNAKWTAERCAVCRWLDDWDYNKLVICNRCQIAVHQECYGVSNVQDFSSWVCRACETPEVEKQCCLCPMKGGALTPTDVDPLWVHITCAWFRSEVTFFDPTIMAMASGILRVPANTFTKECVVCKQVHGSCIQCSKCSTAFHSMCAVQAGYYTELNCSVKKGAQVNRWVTYCAGHSAPNPENVLVVRTPSITFAATTSSSNDQSQDRSLTGSRLVSCIDPEPADGPVTEDDEVDPFSAARCRPFRTSRNKKVQQEPVFHRVMRPFHHPLDSIDSKSSHHELDRLKTFSSLKERLKHLQRTENLRVCFGKSGIHGWGLFARRKILEGEMVIEYLGEQVRKRISDIREKRYKAEGKDCYLFKFSDEVVIDSTNKGNIARIINHSCMPNCYARIFHISDEDSRLVLVTKATVSAGTELTFDYKFTDDNKESLKVPCLCRAPNCRKFID